MEDFVFVVWAVIAVNYVPLVLWTPIDSTWRCFCVVVGHILLVLLLASHLMCVFTDPGTVPLAWHQMIEGDEKLASEHRFCRKSKLYRPLRSHFDSVSRRVVLNMDTKRSH